MHNELALSIISATNRSFCPEWFVHLKGLMNHPHLQEEEKYLWIWLASQSADNVEHSCSFTYQQMSQMLDKTCKFIHRALFRLWIMGFLQTTLPIWYGTPTEEMINEVRVIRPVLPRDP